MLIRLEIENVALIERLSLDLSGGLTILTGETGAGKSILIDSVNLALGGRADRELIRSGCETAMVQAVFDVSDCPAALEWLGEQQLESDGGIVGVSRQISASGRGLVRIAGQVSSLAQLRAFTAFLADVHGQHEHQSLFDTASHLRCVDAYDAEGTEPLLADTAIAAAELMAARKELRRLTGTPQERAQRADLLEYQVREISDARLKPGEEEQLLQRRAFYKNAEKIAEAVNLTREILSGSSSGRILNAAQAMQSVSQYDPWYEKAAEKLSDCYYALEDLSYEIADKADELDYDVSSADEVEDRLALISQLKRKYGATIDEILAHGRAAEAELDKLNQGQALMETLLKREDELAIRLESACDRLSQKRRQSAAAFEKAVVAQLKDLNMAKTRFEVRFTQKEPSANGYDDVEFMLSPNPGEPLRPLAKIASGGELSRIMLALKCITAQRDGIATMIFDEIDTGISGRVASAVADKLRHIANGCQVLCVTHLASIAAAGDAHFLIEKNTRDGRTSTAVAMIAGEARVAEVARLSGGTVTPNALAHAREMLKGRA